VSKEIKIRSIKLTSLILETMDGVKAPRNFNRTTNVQIINIKEKKFEAKVSEHLSFEPEGPFRLSMELTGSFSTTSSFSQEELEMKKEEISIPILSVSSLIIAFITEKVLSGPPLIVPPFIDEDDEDDDDSVSGEDE